MSYYGTIYDDEYLAHHGVKGMKWGVRKDKSSYLSRTRLGQSIKKASFSRGNENYVRLGKRHAIATNGPAYKATVKRKLKRVPKNLAIGAGLAAGATAVGLGLRGIERAIQKRRKNPVSGDVVMQNRVNSQISPAAAENYINYRRAKDINNRINAGKMDVGFNGVSRSNMLNTGSINGIPKPKKKLF